MPSDSLMLTELKSIFSDEDIKYIFSQKKQAESFKIDKKLIHGKKVINTENLDSVNTYSTISLPLFNLEKNIVILRTSYYCGASCGHQGTYIYRWLDSEMILIKTLQEDVY